MKRRPPRSTRTDTLFPYTSPFRSPPLATGGIGHGVRLIEHDHAIEIRPQPFDDLLHTRLLAATFPRAERGVSGEQHALAEPDVRPLAEARERRYQRSEEHTSELQSIMRISYAVFCLKNTKNNNKST